ncbi:HAMP domain-containing sensor histidine kinase [Proteiniphilum saccharofermentans]|uniref:sensor histidine kinase n=1 Tax=Proteiniphilum saccharofermentans TaxID=1642647 RepID=UPI0028A63220|nr:HAMP domain-containing sensor histidine kinase [Proteiniphilum saccharofermentans]
MKRNYTPVLLATALALTTLLISQTLWLQYASNKDIQEQNISFQSCFNKSVSALVNEFMGKDATDLPYKIVPLDEENGENTITPEEKEKAIDAGYTSDRSDVTAMIENALIVLSIRDRSFRLSRLDTLLTTCLNEKGNVVSSHITLQDTKENKVLDEVQQEYIPTNSSFYIKSYTAERKIEIPANSFLIKAEYRIKQPSYLKRLGVVTVASFVASIVIISVLFYLLLMLRHRYAEVSNMERSFHGAIHDLKSPLAYVFFLLSSLEEEETDMTKKASLSLSADRVTFLTDKIMRLLKSTQNIQKIEEADKQIVSLYDILEQIEAEIRTMFPNKKISFEYKVDADFTMRALSDLIEASIRIIIENAVKYNGNSPVVKISAIRDVGNIQIAISDNGVGMNKQQLKNIFKPYYSSDKLQGNGIGLYYAQSIIKAHGGSISVTSDTGKGSTFLITLPNS